MIVSCSSNRNTHYQLSLRSTVPILYNFHPQGPGNKPPPHQPFLERNQPYRDRAYYHHLTTPIFRIIIQEPKQYVISNSPPQPRIITKIIIQQATPNRTKIRLEI